MFYFDFRKFNGTAAATMSYMHATCSLSAQSIQHIQLIDLQLTRYNQIQIKLDWNWFKTNWPFNARSNEKEWSVFFGDGVHWLFSEFWTASTSADSTNLMCALLKVSISIQFQCILEKFLIACCVYMFQRGISAYLNIWSHARVVRLNFVLSTGWANGNGCMGRDAVNYANIVTTMTSDNHM